MRDSGVKPGSWLTCISRVLVLLVNDRIRGGEVNASFTLIASLIVVTDEDEKMDAPAGWTEEAVVVGI